MWLFGKRHEHSSTGSHLQAIRYEQGKLQLLDQRRLPTETKYMDIRDVNAGWKAINQMAVRGAPAIAIAAALSLAADLTRGGSGKQFSSAEAAAAAVSEKFDYLVTSRPTAVNMRIASEAVKGLAVEEAGKEGATGESTVAAVVAACEAMMQEDLTQNQSIGEHGADALLKAAAEAGRGHSGGALRVMTICNTGSLASGGYGTALGVIWSLHARGKLEHAYACETRPYNQGSRLTAYEFVHDKLPGTLICDSAAPSLMAAGKVDAVVVGADRIAANGDTANKIGTMMLAVAAAHFGVPFFVAATLTTVDPNMPDGAGIPIEERSTEEITHSNGRRVAPEGIQVFNPAFDVTPAALITGIITERGAAMSRGAFDMVAFMAEKASVPVKAAPQPELRVVGQALTEDSAKEFIVKRPELSKLVGPVESSDEWKVREVGDGNINFVFIVEGPVGGLCVKQALPFVRCVGESWPLAQERLKSEVEAMRLEAEWCPAHVPVIYDYDAAESVMVMQYLAPPHTILRHAMNQGKMFPHMAAHMAEFLASTLFRSSFLAVPATEFRGRVEASGNAPMCALTEQVIFTEPLFDAPNNAFLRPQMEPEVAALWADPAVKAAVTGLKERFITSTQALLHGDVHTGSVMVGPESTWVIDAEFAFYGPIFFDVGKYLGNLLLNFLSLDGRASVADPLDAQRRWVTDSVTEVWRRFSARFVELWDAEGGVEGGMAPAEVFGEKADGGKDALRTYQARFMEQLFDDCVKMMGVTMIRRTVGLAGVADMRDIADPEVRAVCERRALRLARRLLLSRASSIEAVVAAADKERQDGFTPYFPLVK